MAPRTSGSPHQGKAREFTASDLAPGGNSKSNQSFALDGKRQYYIILVPNNDKRTPSTPLFKLKTDIIRLISILCKNLFILIIGLGFNYPQQSQVGHQVFLICSIFSVFQLGSVR